MELATKRACFTALQMACYCKTAFSQKWFKGFNLLFYFHNYLSKSAFLQFKMLSYLHEGQAPNYDS